MPPDDPILGVAWVIVMTIVIVIISLVIIAIGGAAVQLLNWIF